MSDLLCVAVPGGALRNGEAVLRVLVVPRLSGLAEGAVLSASVMADWPAVLADATLTVHTAQSPTSPSVSPVVRRLDQEQVRPELWPRVFPPTMDLRSYRPPGTYRAPTVGPTADDKAKIEAVYRTAAANPGDALALDRRLRTADLGVRAPARRDSQETRPRAVEKPDFHKVVTMLREHPAVLQALGLIVELRLPEPASLPSRSLVSVEAQLAGAAAEELTTRSFWTSFVMESGRFLPASEGGSDISRGMLDLTTDHWEFATFDVTGAIERIRDAAQSLGTSSLSATTLPALRSSGLSLVRRDREKQLEKRIRTAQRNAARERVQDAVLFADDLVLGYRVDVRTDVGAWSSLMRRSATYTTNDLQPIVDDGHVEEGQIKANAATVEGPVDATRSRQELPLRSDEVVARWDGWSLACPRVLAGPRREGGRSLPHLRWSFTPVGLPELRFGTEYRMRVRIADAAGGGLQLDDPEFTEGESGEVFYGRHDPVPPPFLVPPIEVVDTHAHPKGLGSGGALDIVVIRSNPAAEETVEDYAARYPANDRRVLMPPPTSFRLAEEHEKLDGVDDTTVAAWLRRATVPEEHRPDGTYSWLPDPVAEGVAMTVPPTPGVTTAALTAREAWTSPSGTWPDFTAKTLHLEEATSTGQRTLDWADGGRSAVVRLPPGRAVSLGLTSTVVNDEIDRFMMDEWLRVGERRTDADRGRRPPVEGAPRDVLDDVMRLVRNGLHPMVSPATPLQIVHAVKQPVRPPVGTLKADREPGDTRAILTPSDPMLNLDAPSTGQIAISASWTEVLDNDDPPAEVDDVGVQVSRLDAGASALPSLRHEFGDTRHRQVTYKVRATTRFRDFFDPEPDEAFQAKELEQVVDVPSTARPPAPVVAGVYPAFKWTGTELPSDWQSLERVRLGGRLRVELARPWHLSGDGERLAVVLSAGPSTPRPLVTTIRRDPIWPTPLPPTDPTPDLFLGAVDEPLVLPIAGLGENVTVVPFATHFVAPVRVGEEQRAPGHWFVDIEMPQVAQTSYCPFVHLAVARYQPHSLPGLHLSEIVRAEPAQLMPDRKLTVERGQGSVTVLLSGLTPSWNQVGELGVFDDMPHPPVIRAHLEQWTGGGVPSELTAARPDLPGGWQRIASVSGSVDSTLPPIALPPGGGPLRLVVREVERFRSQSDPMGPADDIKERAVFLDAINLT